MRYSTVALATLAALVMQTAAATPTPEEAAELGKSLTPYGAIKAGNKEGTIPEWTGGICPEPKDKPGDKPGTFPALYADEKPLYKITAANLSQYADKIDDGNKELFKRFPQTYYMLVYPSHRPACVIEYVANNTVKNVMRPKIVNEANPSVSGAAAQIPFPIPKTGVEAMWNTILKPEYPSTDRKNGRGPTDGALDGSYLFVDSSGHITLTTVNEARVRQPYFDTRVPYREDQPTRTALTRIKYPAGQVGSLSLFYAYARPDLNGSPGWAYVPGQRRVRQAPDFQYDGISAVSAGTMLWDETGGFAGNMDRFDFKLLGRKETLVTYNINRPLLNADAAVKPYHLDPEVVRWELHRTWVVEATLKPHERHVQKRKMFYIDEDTYRIMNYVGYDQAGVPFHYHNYHLHYSPGWAVMSQTGQMMIDFSRRVWVFSRYSAESSPVGPLWGPRSTVPHQDSIFSPTGMAGAGVR